MVLDLVVDFLTYVVTPVVAIWRSDLMPTAVAFWLGLVVVVASALYFADTRMKTGDYWFRGFPALWNVVRDLSLRAAAAVAVAAALMLVGDGGDVRADRVRPSAAGERLRPLTIAATSRCSRWRRWRSSRALSRVWVKIGLVGDRRSISGAAAAAPFALADAEANCRQRCEIGALPARRETCYSRALRRERRPGTASWRSGYAEDCKSLHPGSIPGEASNTILRRRPAAARSGTSGAGRAMARRLWSEAPRRSALHMVNGQLRDADVNDLDRAGGVPDRRARRSSRRPMAGSPISTATQPSLGSATRRLLAPRALAGCCRRRRSAGRSGARSRRRLGLRRGDSA